MQVLAYFDRVFKQLNLLEIWKKKMGTTLEKAQSNMEVFWG